MESGNREKRRLALVIQYDGTAFNGLQVQNNGRTVQGELENALHILTKENIRIYASGRTDSGVHALGQVVHFDCESNLTLERLCIGLNGILARDVSVQKIYEVDHDFHARYSARAREYVYKIYNHPQRSPFMQYRAMWVHHSLDTGYLSETLSYLAGEHDFASFCKKKSRLENTVRKINSISVHRDGDYVNITINGNAFLHNMIRIIIGTSLEMFRQGKDPSYIQEILEQKDRDLGGVTAPAYGLYLNRVMYDPDLSSMTVSFGDFQESSK